MEEKFYWLGWSVFPGVGPGKFRLLLDHFKTAKDAWDADQPELKNIIGEKLALDFKEFRKTFSIENYLKKLEEKDVWFLTQKDSGYSQLLLQTDRSPIVLYGKGTDSVGDSNLLASELTPFSRSNIHLSRKSKPPLSSTIFERTIAVVGTRKITSYGREVTEILTRELAQSGFTIVSGLALGVDAIAHKTAIENNGRTIAVLGCGVDLCYPSSNKNLYDKVIDGNGAVISEFPIGMVPSVGSFPSRNRIIAGLSQGVLVTEGAEDSGSLITADYAFKYQRKVFAVPGPITSSLSRGPHKLISKGAKLVLSSRDILKELDSQFLENDNERGGNDVSKNIKSIKGDTEEENRILEILKNEQLHFDEIVRIINLDSSKAGSLLTLMEIKGFIKQTSSGTYSLAMV